MLRILSPEVPAASLGASQLPPSSALQQLILHHHLHGHRLLLAPGGSGRALGVLFGVSSCPAHVPERWSCW